LTLENEKELNNNKKQTPRFNANVLTELGLALAWKNSEQVIIISKKIKRSRAIIIAST